MARIPPLTILLPLLLAGLAALVYIGMMRADREAPPATFTGRPAPDIIASPIGQLPSFDRAALDGPGLKLVNFWASWCAPCRAEHPALLRLADEMPVYGVNQDLSETDAIGFLDELGNPFAAVVFDASKRQSINWGVSGLPETFLIDGDGIVVLRIRGPLTSRVVDSTLRPAITEAMR